MEILNVVQQYFGAWSQHDAAAIVATFAEGGTYSDPMTDGFLTGPAIGAYASGLWATFPDLTFELTSVAPAGEGRVAAQWVMKGTNHGSMNGLPPTGRSISVPGADFIELDDGKIRAVTGYFDSKVVPAQLGLQILVQPHAIGPFAFGSSVSSQCGMWAAPGAFSITSLNARTAEEVQSVREYSRQIGIEMMRMEGFLSFVAVIIGQRMLTITAWENAENPRQLMQGGTHKEAMELFFKDLGAGGVNSVWTPARISPMRVRCLACGRIMNAEQTEGRCTCGELLPDPPPYW